jgi:anti-sigma factor RsiW
MSDTYHPDADRLEAYAEGGLEQAERVVIESHLLACRVCQTALEEWRALFAALEGLPQLEPAAGFADRVMARVRVAPAAGRAGLPLRAWGRRARQVGAAWVGEQAAAAAATVASVLPTTTAGWALATALLALPVAVGAGFVTWLFASTQVTPQLLWAFVSTQVADGANALVATAAAAAMQRDVVAWLVQVADDVLATGATGIGALFAALSITTMLSAWVLYHNLFRTPARESDHALYSF